MKTNTVKKSLIFVQALIFLSGCSDSNLGKGLNLSSETKTLTDKDSLAEYLSKDELELSKNPSFYNIESKHSLASTSFNRRTWPLKCTEFKEKTINACPDKDSQEIPVGIRDLKISGQVFVIDSRQMPWSAIDAQKNIRSLIVEADKVVIRTSLTLPSTHIKLIADHIIVEDGAVLDVTPESPGNVQAPFGKNMANEDLRDAKNQPIAYNGAMGARGSSISIQAPKLDILGSEGGRFVARGGDGESAGQGLGQTEKEIASAGKRAREYSMTPAGDPTGGLLASVAGSIVYSAGYIIEDEICDGNGPCRRHTYKGADAKGMNRWPDNGVDAVPGGSPGAGGAGGSVTVISDSNISTNVADVSRGNDGLVDSFRRGSLAGTPNPAYKVSWDNNYRPILSAPHYGIDGKDAVSSPVPYQKFQENGKSLTLSYSGQIPERFSSNYFQMKLKLIKSLFFNHDFKSAAKEVSLSLLRTQDRNSSDVAGFVLELQAIKQALLNNKDIFGRGLHDVPAYTFSFSAKVFEAELDRTMRAYTLMRIFQRQNKATVAQTEAAESLMKLMEEKLQSNVTDMEATYGLLNSLATQIKNIENNQNGIEAELDNLNRQIEERARRNLVARDSAKQMIGVIKVAAAICKVIPVAQPALMIGASLVEKMVDGPNDNSLAGWINYAGEIKGQFGKYNNTDGITETKDNWKKLQKDLDYENIRGKSAMDKAQYVNEIYKKYSPGLAAAGEELNKLKQPKYDSDEIMGEVAKIRATDSYFAPMFQKISTDLKNLMDQKAQAQAGLLAFNKKAQELVANMSNFAVISAKVSDEALRSRDWAIDGVLNGVFSGLVDDYERKLMDMYSQLVSSYNYVVLENYKGMQVDVLRDQLSSTLERATDDKAEQVLYGFYKTQVDLLRSELRGKILERRVQTRMLEGVVPRQLTEAELAQLNEYGQVNIQLSAEDFGDEENARILEVEVNDSRTDFVQSAEFQGLSRIKLRMDLDSVGWIKFKGEEKDFVYPTTDGVPASMWEHEFIFSPGNDRPDSRKNSEIPFEGLVDDASISSAEMKSILASHAGITTLHIRVKNKKTEQTYKFSRLGINIKYKYSP